MKVDIDKVGVPFFSLSLSPPAESLNYHFLEGDTRQTTCPRFPEGPLSGRRRRKRRRDRLYPPQGSDGEKGLFDPVLLRQTAEASFSSDKDQEAAFSFKVAGTLANFLLSSQYDKRSRIPDLPSLALHFSGVHFLWH